MIKTKEIKIPEIKMSLLDVEKLDLINQDLFQVDGELAQRYLKVLKQVFDLECEVDSFRIDKRGLSPELSEYFNKKDPEKFKRGENYLNISAANRYMIVLSPDQKTAPLISPQTSYEDELYNLVHKQARHTIEDLTASEVLYGELDNGISYFRSPEDLIQFRTIKVGLDTLEGTLNAREELVQMSDKLDEDDNALNEEYISKMKDLVKKVGDIETRALSDIFPIKKEIHCFQAEFFKGVYCLRNFDKKDEVRGIFISHHQKPETKKELGKEILRYDVHEEELIKTLHKYKFLRFEKGLIPQRIKEIEDDVLISEGIDVFKLSPEKYKKLVVEKRDKMPKSWNELNDIARIIENNDTDVQKLMKNKDYTTKIKLSSPLDKHDMINHLLARLDPTDYVRMYKNNIQKFKREFNDWTIEKQRYALNAIIKENERRYHAK